MDIAILTNQPQRCAAYQVRRIVIIHDLVLMFMCFVLLDLIQAESQNVVGRYYCSVPPNWVTMMTSRGMSGFIPITQAECEAISYYDPMYNQTKFGTWMYSPPFGLPAPECREAQWSRDNHLGNVPGSNGQHASFNWTIDPKNVVIRLFNVNPNTHSYVPGLKSIRFHVFHVSAVSDVPCVSATTSPPTTSTTSLATPGSPVSQTV
jgi:hypothetical protein